MNRLNNQLKNKNGASFIFVLCIMFLLLVISASVLVAASTSMGISSEKRNFKQLTVFADSVFDVIAKEMMSDPVDYTSSSLAKKIIDQTYVANRPQDEYGTPTPYQGLNTVIRQSGNFNLNLSDIQGLNGLSVVSSELLLESSMYVIPATNYGSYEPSICYLTPIATFRIKLAYQGLMVTTVAVFEGETTIISYVSGNTAENFADAIIRHDALENGYGHWRLIAYENVKN
jgi:hypothetical protein